ncbi:G-type lectin S-receptor-like serine/threonine-protein kinase [Citrus sinensis]|nr:G-type lectin S-receptor-like serine/threonine-protein kinase [Citrus sinensis]
MAQAYGVWVNIGHGGGVNVRANKVGSISAACVWQPLAHGWFKLNTDAAVDVKFYFAVAIDSSITSSQLIRDPDAILSNGSNFKLGFFNPADSPYRYMGIWYDMPSEKAVIWVANRDNPLKDSSGIITISEDGNLVLVNGQKEVLWSSNVSNLVNNSTSAQLLDSGNLVLRDNINRVIVWESFQEPTDSFLPGMHHRIDQRTGKKVQLTSWKSLSDPSTGSFSAGLIHQNIPEIFVWNDSRPYWRSGPWNGQIFIGIPELKSVYLFRHNYTFGFANDWTFFALTAQGILEERFWIKWKDNWEVGFLNLRTECDVYGKCGAFGICNSQEKPICSCLEGFEPKNAEEWNRGNWTSGCIRRSKMQCERRNITGKVGKEDGFLKLNKMKVPDFTEWTSPATEDECRDQCLKNCSCIAYAFDGGIGCMVWRSINLIDIQRLPFEGTDLYIRVANSDVDEKGKKDVFVSPLIKGMFALAICTLFLWRWIAKRKEVIAKLSATNVNTVKLQDLPLFQFEELATATNNFQLSSKLGQGGFGPVYWGRLKDGQEIAVKRLSKASGQGLEEFMNEVMVISKLQHRNLVRLLGCCVEGEEKMLIYEYMPNRSLDALLFDPLKKERLDWRKRFNIIEGISRGLLYLHRDSRLRIIHRDLKASNILLDEELNPKISDFGMAKIFGGNQDQADTGRVVGTFGYMSPEYAMEGRFSEKSDVFSFGVLLLEIVSGRKNTSFFEDDLTILGYAWKLWNENKILALVDPFLSESSFQLDMIIRCIHVGLLCVQELVKDRPNMSTVVSMLNSEIRDLPYPKEPAFTERQGAVDSESFKQIQQTYSFNDITFTLTAGRD